MKITETEKGNIKIVMSREHAKALYNLLTFDQSGEQAEVIREIIIRAGIDFKDRDIKEICDDFQALCVTKGYRATITEYNTRCKVVTIGNVINNNGF